MGAQIDSAVECQDLTVRYGRFTAADRVSVHARRGQIFGLLGPNGAGKTSVIRALTTIRPASGGLARINGHGLDDAVGIRESIGVLPESNGYPGAQTARSYLRFFGELFGMSPAEAVTEADVRLREMGLAGNHDRISTFSRGMRQRLGLARALINRPAVLFLDEPTLGLDPAGQEELLGHLVRAAVDQGACVVLCSHQLDEVERVCDRVAIMHHGRIVAAGTVEEVVAAAGVASSCTLRVASSDIARAHLLLRDSPVVASVRYDNTRPGDVTVDLTDTHGARAEVLRALLGAGIAPQAFDVQGARLSDAFLSLTAGDRPGVP
jgi:ABC-2 type transport system ATP-binding protein